MGSRLRMTSTGFWSARLPTVSEIFATRAFRSSALARIALSTAGQYFSWSGVSCNAAFTRSIRKSISVFRSAAFNRSGVAGEGVCALAIGDAVRKSAVAPTTTIFIIGDLLERDELGKIDLGFPNQSVSDSPCWLGRRPAWMGQPYSLDLRKRVVAAIEGGMSRNQAAKQFGVAISTAWTGCGGSRDRQRCSGPDGRSQAKGVSEEHAVWLSPRIGSDDFTLRGLVAELDGRGLKVDYRSVWEFVHAEKSQLQKKACSLANAIVPTWRASAPSGQSIKVASKLSGWSSSTRPGPGPIWLPCGDGRRAGAQTHRQGSPRPLEDHDLPGGPAP